MKATEKIAAVRDMFPHVDWFDIYTDVMSVGRNGHFIQYHGKKAIVGKMIDGENNPFTGGSDRWIIGDASEKLYDTIPYEVIVWETLATLNSVDESFGKPKIKPEIFGPLGGKFALTITWPNKRAVGHRDISIQAKVLSSLDRSTKFNIQFGGLELVCTNGLIAYRVVSNVSKRHIINSLNLEKEMEGLQEGLKKYDLQFETWEDMVHSNLRVKAKKSEEESPFYKLYNPLPLGNKQREELLVLPQIGTNNTLQDWLNGGSVNMWDLHSVVTQYVSHELVGGTENMMKKSEAVGKVFDDFLYKEAA